MSITGRIWNSLPGLSLLSNQLWRPCNFIELKTCLGGQCVEQVRNNIRKPFYRPSERLRKKLSYENRLKTPGGRAILMRRILKGRFVLAH